MSGPSRSHSERPAAELLAPATTRVGFVGLGDQGAPIAERIAKAGFALSLWARRPAALEPFFGGPARIADSLEALAAEIDVLCVCVRDDAGVAEVVETALPAMAPASLIIILSTTHPDTGVRLAAKAAQRGLDLIEAPVSGGAESARSGALTVMLGGPQAQCERSLPLLQSFAAHSLRLGELGAGQTAKLLNNALMAANLGLAHETVEAAVALGLERQAFNQVIASSSGRSFAHDCLARLPTLSAFEGGARLLRKDLNLLAELAARSGLTVPAILAGGGDFIDLVARAAGQSPKT